MVSQRETREGRVEAYLVEFHCTTTTFRGSDVSEKDDARVLRDAAEVIKRRLMAGERVRIPGFGAFYLGKVLVELVYPGRNESGPKVHRHKVYFKPFKGLKKSIRENFD